MAKETISVPDIGGAENVDVIEIYVSPGDVINADDPIIVLESEKASMDIPTPKGGKVVSVLVKEGDTVSEGDAVLELELDADASSEPVESKSDNPKTDKPKTDKPKADKPKSDKPREAAVSAEEPPQASAAKKSAGNFPVNVPDIGGAENVDVIEVCVAEGDEINEGDSLIVLESDKASMDVPSPASGKVLSISVSEGDKVSQGSPILVLSSSDATAAEEPKETVKSTKAAVSESTETESAVDTSGVMDVKVPAIGGAEGVDVIEVSVAEGDQVSEGDSLIVLESDKASMEVPSPASGKVISIAIKEGDKVSEGADILKLEIAGAKPQTSKKPVEPKQATQATQTTQATPSIPAKPTEEKHKTSNQLHPQEIQSAGSEVYAGPAVRQLARQLGVDLGKVKASGPRGRILKDDVRNYVKNIMQSKSAAPAAVTGGAGIPPIPAVDFSQFGEVELVKMSKIKKLTAANMSRNWLNVPHVTQFDDADITDLEEFRKSIKDEAEKAGVKLTPLPFLLKACASALKAEPRFNASLHGDGEHIVQKKYIHIGIAVDTPNGLMVPVIRDVDKKGLYELATESSALAAKARDGKLMPKDMQGGCFTISSLGPIGGTGFTPIVNAPEVAILGVSKADIKPVWNGKEFVPRQMLPLCLSYDHRAINGADAGRFITYLSKVLSDVRRILV